MVPASAAGEGRRPSHAGFVALPQLFTGRSTIVGIEREGDNLGAPGLNDAAADDIASAGGDASSRGIARVQ